jgi:hypothetical protein
VEFQAAGDSAFTTSSLRAPAHTLPAALPVVLVPRSMALSGGTFAGTVVGINIPAALQACAIVSSQCVTGYGFYASYFRTGVVGWETLPITVSTSGFSDADTAIIWDALHAMEDAVGRLLFTTQAGQGGFIGVSSGSPPGITESFAGYAVWGWDDAGRMTGAHIWFVVRPNRILVQHEFLHALGFGHTCAWLSPMGGYGCRQVEMSAQDVAYLLLARAFFAAETSLRLPSGQLPCGYMGLLAGAAIEPAVVSCDGDLQRLPPSAQADPATRLHTIGMP